VASLKARAGSSLAAAYNALSAEGRFKEHLSEADGKLRWKESSEKATTGKTAPV
jgi:hypothetical protein